jgi:uncharacterized membrane protein YeaQ/YmgE (transglycosylase-associated protein family)
MRLLYKKTTISITKSLLEKKLMNVMELVAWLVIGGVAGWLASMVMKTNSQQGLLMDIIVGIIGAFIGGFVLNSLGLAADTGDFSWLSLGTAFLGAVILIGILKMIRRA